jgi:hypothetical protein
MTKRVCLSVRGKLLAVVVVVGILLVPVKPAIALGINIDFSYPTSPVSSAYGAASGQAGYWNEILNPVQFGGTQPFALRDLSGAATTSSLSFSFTGSFFQNPVGDVHGDAEALIGDFFYVPLGNDSYSVSITGLQDGQYDVYLYAPASSTPGPGNFDTGPGTVNGVAFANAVGQLTSSTLVLGQNYTVASGVTVSGGTLLVAGQRVAADRNLGLSGMQLVPQTSSSPVPEPASLLLLGTGGLGLMAARLHQRKARVAVLTRGTT